MIALIASLVFLDASLTFHNAWPTPSVGWSGELSVELAACILGLALFQTWKGSPTRRAIRGLAAVWLLLAIGRYIHVTAPALWGREINFYWDLPFVPDVAAMLARAARPVVVAGAVAGTLLALALLYLALQRAIRVISDAMSRPRPRHILAIAAGAAVVLFAGQQLRARAPILPRFSTPVTHTYARQVRFVIEAVSGARTLPASPSFSSDLSLVEGADMLLFFLESYGAVTFERPEFKGVLAGSRAALEAAIRQRGRHVVSAYVESPTFGGSSWFAHLTLLSGITVGDPDTNALLMTARRDTLPAAFARRGYRAVALMPGLWYPWPEGSLYGFSEIYNGDRLTYRGPPFGWWSLPDQFTLARLDELELNRHARSPVFVFFPTVTTHAPFSPTPPYQPDWSRMLTARPFDEGDVERAYEQEMDWMNLGPSYVRSVSYAYRMLAGYLSVRETRDFVMILIGDHQPPALVSGEGAPWDVPVHIIASRSMLLDRLRARGFRSGLTPERPTLGPMQSLLPILLEAFGNSDPTLAE